MSLFQKNEGEENDVEPEEPIYSVNIPYPKVEECVNWDSLYSIETDNYRLSYQVHAMPCYVSFNGICSW